MEAENEFRYLTEVLDLSAKFASKNADVQSFGMFEVILTDLKKRKQYSKLFEIAQNLLHSVGEEDRNHGDVIICRDCTKRFFLILFIFQNL